MEYDILHKLSPEETLHRLPNSVGGKNKKTYNRQNFKSSRAGKIEINMTNILPTELAESVLEVSLLLAQMGSLSELLLFTYG